MSIQWRWALRGGTAVVPVVVIVMALTGWPWRSRPPTYERVKAILARRGVYPRFSMQPHIEIIGGRELLQHNFTSDASLLSDADLAVFTDPADRVIALSFTWTFMPDWRGALRRIIHAGEDPSDREGRRLAVGSHVCWGLKDLVGIHPDYGLFDFGLYVDKTQDDPSGDVRRVRMEEGAWIIAGAQATTREASPAAPELLKRYAHVRHKASWSP